MATNQEANLAQPLQANFTLAKDCFRCFISCKNLFFSMINLLQILASFQNEICHIWTLHIKHNISYISVVMSVFTGCLRMALILIDFPKGSGS